jgi:arylsulfatase A-like enzyme
MAGFKASARSLDQGVGAVLEALDGQGLGANTLVVLTTDHGLAVPGAKATLYDRGLGVMLILRGPGRLGGGRVHDALVSHLDIYPTICDLVGIEHPTFLQGESLMPLVRGDAATVRDTLFAEMTWHAAYDPQRAVRTERFKYIRRFGTRETPVLVNCDDSPSKTLLVERGWAERRVPFEQLYDLTFDPNEAENLVDDPAYAPIAEDLGSRLDSWMRDTDDPLLHGDPQPPPGAQINDPDQVSATEPLTTIAGPQVELT